MNMQENQIEVQIEQFRAIEKADIVLNGITVVAGENGCGKSTLSKFLYYVFKLSEGYEETVDNYFTDLLTSLRSRIENFHYPIRLNQTDIGYTIDYFSLYLQPVLSKIYWKELLSQLENDFQNVIEKDPAFSLVRYEQILKDLLKISPEETYSLPELIGELEKYIEDLFGEYEKEKKNKSVFILTQELKKILQERETSFLFSIREYGDTIIDTRQTHFSTSHFIRQTAYIDTPMSVGLDNQSVPHWKELNRLLKEKKEAEYDLRIGQILSEDILKGNIYTEPLLEKDIHTPFADEAFIYKREDGSEFNLLECATGVKSFAVLQMLLKNGFLNKYTLLIVDEPEAHLHPQWIIEYARLIVLLNKHVGVKFFIASHNPDMVSAIRYISETEGTDKRVNFYIAEKAPDYTYTYRGLGQDIEPIFESFNIALDRINQYGSRE